MWAKEVDLGRCIPALSFGLNAKSANLTGGLNGELEVVVSQAFAIQGLLDNQRVRKSGDTLLHRNITLACRSRATGREPGSSSDRTELFGRGTRTNRCLYQALRQIKGCLALHHEGDHAEVVTAARKEA